MEDSAEEDGRHHGNSNDDDEDIDVTNDIDVVTGKPRLRGEAEGAPTTGEYMGVRKKRREAALLQKEEERTKRAEEALSFSMPKGRKWARLLRKEEELEDEISLAQTEDIASKLVEQSVKIFKIADCSNSMKGNLVKELRKAAALVRAATSVMAVRARESGRCEDNEEFLKIIKELRADNGQLKKEI